EDGIRDLIVTGVQTCALPIFARDAAVTEDAFPLGALIDEAYNEARKHQPARNAQLKFETGGSKSVLVTGDRAALRHALTEVLIKIGRASCRERVSSSGRGVSW